MSLSKHVLTALVAGLLLVSASASAAKPGGADCPCYFSDPGLYYETIKPDCIGSLNMSRTVSKQHVEYYRTLDVATELGESCFYFYVSTYGNQCFLEPGIMTTDTACYRDGGTHIYGLSDEQMKACDFLLINSWRYLDNLPDCD